MRHSIRRVPGVLLAVVATLGAYEAWSGARASHLLAHYEDLVHQATSTPAKGAGIPAVPDESTGEAATGRSRTLRTHSTSRSYRMQILLRAIEHGGVTSEARTGLAIERVAEASSLAMSEGDSDPGSPSERQTGKDARREATDELRMAFSDVRESLRAFPGSSQGWLAGYRVIETAGILGLDVLAGADAIQPGAGGSPTLAAGPDLEPEPGPAPFDPAASVRDLREPLRDPSRLARAFLAGALRCDPNGGSLQHQIGTVMLAAGHPEDAFAYLARAARDLSASPVAIATEMLDAGFSPDDVLAEMPPRADVQVRVGGLLLSRRFDEAAEKAFHDAARLDPGLYQPWAALAELAERRGRHAEAIAFTKRILSALPETDPATCSRILFCAAQASRAVGDTVNAIAYGSRALRYDPRRALLHDFMASLLLDSSDAAGAIHHWQVLIDEHGSDPDVAADLPRLHRLVGRSYEKLGMRERAVEHYLDALRASPRDADARAALERLARPR